MSNGLSFRRRSGFLLATLGRRAESAWGAYLRGRGITNSEFAAVAVLVDATPSQGELAAHLGIDPRNAGALVGRLTKRGWVEGERDPRDGRRTLLRLTPAGRAAWDEIQGELAGQRGGFFDALEAAELRELERLLNKLNDAHVAGSGRGGA